MAETLIIYASFGEGHKRAALALRSIPNSSCRDLLDFAHPLLRKIYCSGYNVVTQNFPYFWRFLFSLGKNRFFSFLLDRVNRLIFSSFFKFLEENNPRIVVATHFFPPNVIAKVKEKMGIKLISVITDLRVHPSWANSCIDHYFVSVDEAKRDLIKLGVREDKITARTAALREDFFKDYSKDKLRDKFRLSLKPCITFVSSSRGRFPFLKKTVKPLLNKFNVFVIYGRNKKLKRYLEGLSSPDIRIFPFYEEIWELISLSDIIITKPGGLTVFEGVCKKKAFIFTHYIPGQEKQNMELLIKYGVAKFVKSERELMEAVQYFEKNREQIEDNYPLEFKDIRQPLDNLIKTGSA